ncbi:hypothetical protein G7046_g2066 [Stylonectria norvegica]|nr:hypothetical protein G7046_g2066 [Stylonectria norvegica]
MPVHLDNESDLREAQAALFNQNSQNGWLLLNYVSPSTLHFSAGGEGGVDELRNQLEDDQIQYALVRVLAEGKVRDVFVAWTGPGVGIIEKGKKFSHTGDAQAFLKPYHAEVTVHNKKKFNEENLIDRSNPASTSHDIN